VSDGRTDVRGSKSEGEAVSVAALLAAFDSTLASFGKDHRGRTRTSSSQQGTEGVADNSN
jgi:hypothetical protein